MGKENKEIKQNFRNYFEKQHLEKEKLEELISFHKDLIYLNTYFKDLKFDRNLDSSKFMNDINSIITQSYNQLREKILKDGKIDFKAEKMRISNHLIFKEIAEKPLQISSKFEDFETLFKNCFEKHQKNIHNKNFSTDHEEFEKSFSYLLNSSQNLKDFVKIDFEKEIEISKKVFLEKLGKTTRDINDKFSFVNEKILKEIDSTLDSYQKYLLQPTINRLFSRIIQPAQTALIEKIKENCSNKFGIFSKDIKNDRDFQKSKSTIVTLATMLKSKYLEKPFLEEYKKNFLSLTSEVFDEWKLTLKNPQILDKFYDSLFIDEFFPNLVISSAEETCIKFVEICKNNLSELIQNFKEEKFDIVLQKLNEIDDFVPFDQKIKRFNLKINLNYSKEMQKEIEKRNPQHNEVLIDKIFSDAKYFIGFNINQMLQNINEKLNKSSSFFVKNDPKNKKIEKEFVKILKKETLKKKDMIKYLDLSKHFEKFSKILSLGQKILELRRKIKEYYNEKSQFLIKCSDHILKQIFSKKTIFFFD